MADGDHPPFTGRATRVVGALVVVLLAALVTGAAVLWPDGSGPRLAPAGTPADATLERVRTGACLDTDPAADIDCTRIEARLDSGGLVALDELPASAAEDLAPGDEVVVRRHGSGADVSYELAGRQRSWPLATLGGAAFLLLAAFARWRGVRLALALAASGGVLIAFAVPAVLDGADATAVGVVAGGLIASVVVVATAGPGTRPATAVVGAILGVAAAGATSQVVVEVAALADLGSSAPFLQFDDATVPLAGLLVAGAVVGAAGAVAALALRLVDATWELRDLEPGAGWLGVARAGARRGREALTSTAGALAVAYAGAALPIIVLLAAGDQAVLDGVRSEDVAVELGRVLAGIAGLCLTVPLTVAVAALVVVREPLKRRPDDPRRFRSRGERDLWEDPTES